MLTETIHLRQDKMASQLKLFRANLANAEFSFRLNMAAPGSPPSCGAGKFSGNIARAECTSCFRNYKWRPWFVGHFVLILCDGQ